MAGHRVACGNIFNYLLAPPAPFNSLFFFWPLLGGDNSFHTPLGDDLVNPKALEQNTIDIPRNMDTDSIKMLK